MFGIGTGELLLIMFIALLVLGPERMPQLARDIGKAMNDLRKTSEELQKEFLSADKTLSAEKVLDAATRLSSAAPETGKTAEVGATTGELAEKNEVTTPTEPTPPPEPEETAFDRDARLARERIEDPEKAKEHAERAASEGWTVPTDEAGTSDRVG